MTSKRLNIILLSVISLLLIALPAGAYGINSLLTTEANKLTSLKAKEQALQQEQTALAKAKKDIAKYSELEKITRSVVPEDKNQAEAVREIVKIAAENNISLASITFPASTLGNTPSGAPAVSAATGVAAAPSSTKTLSQLVPVKNISGVYQLLIAVTGDPDKPVPYDKFVSFLSDLEHNRRTAQVGSISIQPNTANRNLLTFNLNLTEYIKP